MTARRGRQITSIHKRRAPLHGATRQQVFTNRLFQKPFRRDHLQPFTIAITQRTVNTPEVIDMAMCKNHRHDFLVAQVLAGKVHGRCRCHCCR